MSKLEINLSSTALGRAGCILSLRRTVVDGYKELAHASRLVYGIAVHKYVDTMYKTGGDYSKATLEARKAFALPKIDDRKSPHLSDERHLLNTCMTLWTTFIQDESEFEVLLLNGVPATEITFSILFYEDEFVKIYICGTIDKIGQFKGGCFAIGDWKSTSSWDNVSYFKSYEMSKQLRLYTLACKLMAQREPESTLGRIGATRMGAFIDAIFLKPNASENTVKRSEVYQLGDADLVPFERTLHEYCQKISLHVQQNYFPKEGILNGSCEGKWGKCSFWNVCKAHGPVGEILLKRDFRQVPFDPLNYNDLD